MKQTFKSFISQLISARVFSEKPGDFRSSSGDREKRQKTGRVGRSGYRKTTSHLEEPSRHHAKNDTTNPFGYKLGESTENNNALLFFSGKERIQTFNGSI